MPNWCSNHMVISGNEQRVAELVSEIIRPDSDNPSEMTFDFNGILPIPEELLEVSYFCSQDEIQWGQLDDVLNVLAVQNKISDELYHKLKAELEKVLDWNTLTVSEINNFIQTRPELQRQIGLYPERAKTAAYNLKHHGEIGWYNWCNRYWGTKWNAHNCYIEHQSDGLLDIWFDTAWSPPVGVYRAICESYPDLNLVAKYIEDGMGFAGYYENIDSDLYDHPCEGFEEYRLFAKEHFGYDDDDECDE